VRRRNAAANKGKETGRKKLDQFGLDVGFLVVKWLDRNACREEGKGLKEGGGAGHAGEGKAHFR